MKQEVYQKPAMVVVGLQPGKAMLQGVSGRKNYEVTDENPFADENNSGVKDFLTPNLWDEEW